MYDVGYTLEAIHEGDGKSIVSMRLSEESARELMLLLWEDIDFWEGPGGGSTRVESADQVAVINRVLGNCELTFAPEKHRWHFHVHLV